MNTITTTTLAKFVGVSVPFLSEVRHGKKRFSSKKARQIAGLTGLSLEHLLFSEGHEIYRSLAIAYGYQRTIKQEAQP